MSLFQETGIFAYPLCFYTVVTALALVVSVRHPSRTNRKMLRSWGMVTFFLGLLGTILGFQQVSAVVSHAAPDTMLMMMMDGSEMAMNPLVWGATVAVVAFTGSILTGTSWPRVELKVTGSDRASACKG